MKVKPYITALLIGIAQLMGQNAEAQTQPGFVQQDVIKIAGITVPYQADTLNKANKQTTRAYYDGLGRTLQTVALQASPLQNDLIQPVVYDNLGRQTTGYLPYTGLSTDSAGSYRSNAISTGQPNFYNQTSQHLIPVDAAPYNQQVFENSPLQRLLNSGMVGTGFQPGVGGAHYKIVSYRPNNSTSDGSILQWNPDGSYTPSTYYANNTLSVTDGKDEDNIETLTFTDLEGHLILKRQILTGGNLDTYYIYNNAGMVNYIIPPKAMATMVANGSYNINAANVVVLIFHYTYNSHGQLVTKTIPGKGTMNTVYDPLNRPVLVQDSNMRVNNQWNYIKYDAKGRVISQGIYTDATHTSLSAMQTYVSGLSYAVWYELRSHLATATGYYTNNVFPTTGSPLAYAYFDDYYMTEGTSPDFTYATTGLPGEIGATLAQVKGMPTMTTKTTVGTGIASGTWLTTVIFYDKRGNTIQTQSNNQLKYTNATTLTDVKTVVPNFIHVTQVSLVKKVTGTIPVTTTVQTNFTYDQMNRVTAISQQYNGGAAIPTAAYTYNEIGQVVAKNLGQIATGTIPANLTLTSYSATTAVASNSITLSPTFTVPSGSAFSAVITSATGYLQTVDYRYNIRGQLLNINNSKLSYDGGVTNSDYNDLFGMQFLYDQTDGNLNNGAGNTPSYDGKLTAVKWMSKDANGNSSYERSFTYNYDGINRYTGETYSERTVASTGSFNNNVDGFDESGITYDAGGNILTLARNSSTQGTTSHIQIDNLTYGYNTANPNQLLTVTDGTGSNYTGAGFRNLTGSTGNYSYDANGNLTADPYKGLTIAYDVLNRTDKITVTTGTNQYIYYIYDASGNLVRKQAFNNGTLQTTTDYIDGFVYLTAGTGAPVLSYFPMPEGRVLYNGTTFTQEFIITDQQGNARLSFQNNGSGTAVVKQENSYYGFGLIMLNSPVSTPATPNKQLYNGGSEWQNDYSNLPDYYQTFNRNYDAAIARFVGVDPAADGAESMTSYQYAGNNPIMNNDPLGNVAVKAPIPVGPYGAGAFNFNSWHNDDVDYGFGGGPDGLYYSNPAAYWNFYNSTNGTLGGTSLYNAGNGTADDPSTGSLAAAQTAINIASGAYGPNTGIGVYNNSDGSIEVLPTNNRVGVSVWDQNSETAGLGVGYTLDANQGGTFYPDGSAFFTNETQAYNYMWRNSNYGKSNTVENFAYITKNGVAVLPTHGTKTSGQAFQNTAYSAVWSDVYKMTGQGSTLAVDFNGTWIYPIASIHTHPGNKFGDNEAPDGWDTAAFRSMGIPGFILGPNHFYGVTMSDLRSNSYESPYPAQDLLGGNILIIPNIGLFK